MLSPAGTNNDYQTTSRVPWLLVALLAIAAIRLWRLPEAGLPDYDSVHNWQILQELAAGNFTHLFHHGSPGFFLLYAPVALFTRDFLLFQTLNALIGVGAVGFFSGWVSRQARLTGMETACLVLLAGTSLLLTFSGRDFTMSSVDLVVFTALLRSHFRRLHNPSQSALLCVAGWLALGLCFDYKFIFTLPILLVLEAWAPPHGLWRRGSTWAKVGLVMVAPYAVLAVVAAVVGLPWYRWLAFYVRVAMPVAANPAGRQVTLDLDFLYYGRYLVSYESPLLIIGLALAAWQVWDLWRRGTRFKDLPVVLLPYLLVWAACLLAGMSLLVKAPRGLLFAYPLLAALAVLSGRRLLPGWAVMSVGLAAVVMNVVHIQQELYAPLPNQYQKVAAWLQSRGITRVASTVGLGLAPYLPAHYALTVVNHERELAKLRQQGYQYVLLDGYWRVAGVQHFDSIRSAEPLAAWPAPQLQRPLLFLEHSEYTGLGYTKTLAAARAAIADTLPLRVYRLQ